MDISECDRAEGYFHKPYLKRKRTTEEILYDTATLSSPMPTEVEFLDQVAQDPCPSVLGFFSTLIGGHDKPSTIAKFGSQTPGTPQFIGKDRTFIQIAQTLADQAVSGLEIFDLHRRVSTPSPAKLVGSDQHIAGILGGLAANAGKSGKRCNLKDFALCGDQHAAHRSLEQMGLPQNQRSLKPTCPTRLPTAGIPSIFRLHPPYTRVQRTGAPIDVDASALHFWEELSLAPSHEGKDVTAFCIYPINLDVHNDAMTFLNMIGGAYQSCNMGSFILGSCPVDHNRILPPVPIEDLDGSRDLLSHMELACDQFGRRIAEQKLQHGNTAIYIINSYGPQYLPVICAGFLKIFDAYNVAMKQKQIDNPNDLLLQIVTSQLIYSSDAIIMPLPSDYRKLALDVYDHCGPNRSNEHKQIPQYVSTPAIRLAKAIPKTIDLRLNPDSSGPILQSDNCLHVAYAWSLSDRWLTASWTDNLGILSWTACYCFGEEEETPWQAFSDIAKEIWETTCNMMRSRSVPWRLFICKDSLAYRKEVNSRHFALLFNNGPIRLMLS